MAHRAPQDHWRGLRPAMPGQRTRVIVAMLGLLLSVGTPVMVLGLPGLTVGGQPAGTSLGDPAGLGITGALPGDPLPDGGVLDGEVPGDSDGGVPGDSGGAGPGRLSTALTLPEGPLGIPGVVLDAYQRAERTLVASRPGCHLSWSVLAGIGRIESGHASDGRVDALGNTLGPILGPALDGSPGVAAITDTDRGALDSDPVWDRAVGPMQFIPTSWRSYSVDGNGDGASSPHNIYDSTVAAGSYLCAGDGDLADPTQLQAAVFRYNHSATYVTIVLRWAQAYLSGVVPTTPAPGPVPPGTNGNGGAPILADDAPQAAQVAVVQPAPVQPAPLPDTTAPATTTTTSPPETTTTSSPPGTTTPLTSPPMTTTTSPPLDTTTPTTTTSPPPVTTTTSPPPHTTTPTTTTTSPPPETMTAPVATTSLSLSPPVVP